MDPVTIGLIGAGIGIGGMSLFGKKSKKMRLPPQPQLSEMGKWSQEQLYGAVQRGMAGGGLFNYDRFGPVKTALTKAYGQTKPMLASFLNRMVPRADVKVRGYADETLKRSYYGGMQDLREQEKLAPYEEQQEAMNMAAQLLGEEKRLGANIMDIYNQGAYAQSQMPTFGSQLGYGLGSAGGILAASQRYAQLMSSKGTT